MRWAGALLLALVCLGLSGCWDVIPVEELGIVTLLFVDQTPQGTRVIAQVQDAGSFAPREHDIPRAVEATGPTFFEAMDLLNNRSSKKLFLGVLQGVAVTERAARGTALRQALDYLLRDVRARATAWLWLMPSDQIDHLARIQVLAAETTGRSLSDRSSIATLFTAAKATRIFEFARDISTPGQAAVAPVLTMKGQEIAFEREALFRGVVLAGTVPADSLGGIPWLFHTPPEEASASISVGHTTLGVIYKDRRRVIEPVIRDGVLEAMVLKLRARIMVANVTQGGFPVLTPGRVDLIERAASQRIVDDVSRTLEVSRRLGADIAGFGFRLGQVDPRLMARLGPAWDREVYPRIPIVIHAKTSLMGGSMSHQST